MSYDGPTTPCPECHRSIPLRDSMGPIGFKVWFCPCGAAFGPGAALRHGLRPGMRRLIDELFVPDPEPPMPAYLAATLLPARDLKPGDYLPGFAANVATASVSARGVTITWLDGSQTVFPDDEEVWVRPVRVAWAAAELAVLAREPD